MTSSAPARPRCSVYIAVSLDGYIARPDGNLDFLAAVQQEGEDYGYRAFMDSVDVLVVGRKTYDTVLGFGDWPYSGKRCVVLTHRPPDPRNDEEFFAGSPRDLVDRLGREGARRVYVDGGIVVRQFLEAGLVDDLTLSVIPVLLGAGIRLFDGGARECRLHLEEARPYPSGLVQLRYRVA